MGKGQIVALVVGGKRLSAVGVALLVKITYVSAFGGKPHAATPFKKSVCENAAIAEPELAVGIVDPNQAVLVLGIPYPKLIVGAIPK